MPHEGCGDSGSSCNCTCTWNKQQQQEEEEEEKASSSRRTRRRARRRQQQQQRRGKWRQPLAATCAQCVCHRRERAGGFRVGCGCAGCGAEGTELQRAYTRGVHTLQGGGGRMALLLTAADHQQSR
jgi:hypothetical protein